MRQAKNKCGSRRRGGAGWALSHRWEKREGREGSGVRACGQIEGLFSRPCTAECSQQPNVLGDGTTHGWEMALLTRSRNKDEKEGIERW